MKSNKSTKREASVAKFIINVMTRGTLNREAQLRVLAIVSAALLRTEAIVVRR